MSGRGDLGPGGRLFVKTGVVKRSKCFHFETMLFRISRGNIYYRQAALDKLFKNPFTNSAMLLPAIHFQKMAWLYFPGQIYIESHGKQIRKVAFLAICQGEQLSVLMDKVFTGFRVVKYPCPTTFEERREKIMNIHRSIADLEKVLTTTTYHRCKALRSVGHQWKTWMVQVRKSKAVFHTMNLFSLDISKNCLIGQCWVPDKDLKLVQQTLKTCSREIGTNVTSFLSKTETKMVPPTFHRTNKFTHGFQALINAYGDSKYRELNPGLYTIITFPFLFALMYGDIGHATILILFGSWMLKNEAEFMAQDSDNEIWRIFFGGRYIILMLGMFSFYTGFIYNDVFSVHMAIQSSYFLNAETSKDVILGSEFLTIDPAGKVNAPYPYGVDPIWGFAVNKIIIQNMIKMKMSIIIGIIHMVFGILLSLFNYIHDKTYYLIILQFIPEFVFLCSLFMWLVIMIYFKWFAYGAHHTDLKHQPGCAPPILILFIDMILFKETKADEEACDAFLFKGQWLLQRTLMVIGLVCVPILLFGTPVYVNRMNNKKHEQDMAQWKGRQSSSLVRRRVRTSMERREKSHLEVKEEMEWENDATFSELMIHQAVHTIEFVLSTISHTASYLRLWALSLAHAQLAEMLWRMVLSKLALSDHSLMGIPKLFVIFAVWATFTLSILVLMEGLSAFLHTLRLHWVEFMSKFYHAGGYPFRPFCFKEILSAENDKLDAACKKKETKKPLVEEV